jgi:hypothetical protein
LVIGVVVQRLLDRFVPEPFDGADRLGRSMDRYEDVEVAHHPHGAVGIPRLANRDPAFERYGGNADISEGRQHPLTLIEEVFESIGVVVVRPLQLERRLRAARGEPAFDRGERGCRKRSEPAPIDARPPEGRQQVVRCGEADDSRPLGVDGRRTWSPVEGDRIAENTKRRQ